MPHKTAAKAAKPAAPPPADPAPSPALVTAFADALVADATLAAAPVSPPSASRFGFVLPSPDAES